MTEIDRYLSEIDSKRLRRTLELSELKVRMASPVGVSRYGVHSKAVIVLSYAHWEGFYNDCVQCYVEFLRNNGRKVRDVSWSMMIGLLRPGLQGLRDRNHSREAELNFVNKLESLIEEGFDNFDVSVVLSRSNLDFDALRHNFEVLGFDLDPFLRWRLKITKELVSWRHGVAHGNDPDLSLVSLKEHIAFTQDMLLLLADTFQGKMVN